MTEYEALTKSYGRQAADYDRRWRRYNEASLLATFAAVPWDRVRSLLDVGCGTGLLEEMVGRQYHNTRMTCIDASLAMLQRACTKMPVSAPTSWINALAEALPFATASFDAVICANCFHYIRQPARAIQEFRRVLSPGGCLVITDWCDDYLACRICNLVLSLFDQAHFRMYGMRDCANLLKGCGFQIETAERFKIDWIWGLMVHRAIN